MPGDRAEGFRVGFGQRQRVLPQRVGLGDDAVHQPGIVPGAVAVPGDHGQQRRRLRGVQGGGGAAAWGGNARGQLVQEGRDGVVAHAARLPRTARTPYSWIMRGYTQDKDAYLKRLRRIEGQVRGLQRMVESDTYCIDVLTQVSAVTRALQAVALGLVEDHLGHCVTQAIKAGGPEADAKVKEASEAIARLVRS